MSKAKQLLSNITEDSDVNESMSESQLESILMDAFYEAGFDDVQSFQDAGMMSNDNGIVVKSGSSRFKITIQKS